MRLNDDGKTVEACWLAIPTHFPSVHLDAIVVMPNHVHGIVVIADRVVGAKNFSPLRDNGDDAQSHSVAIQNDRFYRSRFQNRCDQMVSRKRGTRGKVWQRNYYEHVIRNEESLSRIRQYIHENPTRWAFDRENPAAVISESDEEQLM